MVKDMKKCQCLKYALLLANKKDEAAYVFTEGALVPIEAVYPLEDFVTKTGALVCVCPYYNHTCEGRLIPRAFEQIQRRTLSREDRRIISDAVDNCEHFVDIRKHLIFSARYKEIIELFCTKYNQRPIVKLLKHFLSFIKKRADYMDKTKCDGVSPDEKKTCFDDLWVEGFGRYLNDVGFSLAR